MILCERSNHGTKVTLSYDPEIKECIVEVTYDYDGGGKAIWLTPSGKKALDYFYHPRAYGN